MKREVGEPIRSFNGGIVGNWQQQRWTRRRRTESDSRPRCGIRCAAIVLAVLVALCGCRKQETRFDIYSTGDRDNPELFTEFFEPGAFSISGLNNWRIVFEMPEVMIQVEEPTAEGQSDGAAGEPTVRNVPMAQYVQIEVFWQPLPGTTYAESSQINASIVYCLVTASDAISYEGAGFVYFSQSRDGETIEGRIESATLVPVRRAGSPRDIFGPCRLNAEFTAEKDAARVVSVVRRLQKLLGRPAPASRVPLIQP